MLSRYYGVLPRCFERVVEKDRSSTPKFPFFCNSESVFHALDSVIKLFRSVLQLI